MEIDPDRLRTTRELLAAVRFNQWATPDRKLPACPGCGEDELYSPLSHSSTRYWRCYRCRFEFTIPVEATP